MDDTEKQLFSNYKTVFIETIDPIAITDGLYQAGHLTVRQRFNIYKIASTFPDTSNVWNALLILIPPICKLKQFIHVLVTTGYTEISMEMSEKLRLTTSETTHVCRLYRTKTGNSSQRFAQRLFMNFKINTHNNAFVNPRKYAHDESQKYKIQFERLDGSDEEMKRSIADRYVACLLAEIDSHIMLYSRKVPAHDLLKELKRMIPETSDSNITQLSYNSRIAMTCALAGKDDESEEHLQNAISVSVVTGRCVEISNLYYIYVFNLLCRYEKYPTKSLRQKIIHIAELGLLSSSELDISIMEFWTRIFVLRIVYCLLALSFRGDPIYYINVDKHSIVRAKQLLTGIDRLWASIESRRKIMYYVAKARISELEKLAGYNETALYYLYKAINICNEGQYGETEYVKQYASYFRPMNDGNITHSECCMIGKACNNSIEYIEELSKTPFHVKNFEMSYRDRDKPDHRLMKMENPDKSNNLQYSSEGNVTNQAKSVDIFEKTFKVVKIRNERQSLVERSTDTILKELNISKVQHTQPKPTFRTESSIIQHGNDVTASISATSYMQVGDVAENSSNTSISSTSQSEQSNAVQNSSNTGISNTLQGEQSDDILHQCKIKSIADDTNTAVKMYGATAETLLKTKCNLDNSTRQLTRNFGDENNFASFKTIYNMEAETFLKDVDDNTLNKFEKQIGSDMSDERIDTDIYRISNDEIMDETLLKAAYEPLTNKFEEQIHIHGTINNETFVKSVVYDTSNDCKLIDDRSHVNNETCMKRVDSFLNETINDDFVSNRKFEDFDNENNETSIKKFDKFIEESIDDDNENDCKLKLIDDLDNETTIKKLDDVLHDTVDDSDIGTKCSGKGIVDCDAFTESYTPAYTESYTPAYTESYTPAYTESYTPAYTKSYTSVKKTDGKIINENLSLEGKNNDEPDDESRITLIKSIKEIKDETTLKATKVDEETLLKTSQNARIGKTMRPKEAKNVNIFQDPSSFQDIHQ